MDKRDLDVYIREHVSVTLNDGRTYNGHLGVFSMQGTPLYNIDHKELFCAFRVNSIKRVDKTQKKELSYI